MRPVRPTLFLLAAIGLGACGESAAPRDPLHGSSLSVVAVRGSKDSTSDAVDSVDIVVRRGDGSVAGHGAAFFPAGVDTVPVVVTLIVTNDVETLTLTMELLANGTVVYTTTNTITVRRGESNSAPSVVPAVWSKLTPTIGPAPRVGPATAFDASRGVLVMFGGLVLGQPQTDTWEWDRAAGWRVIATTGNPPGRAAHTMVYDPIRHVVVAFGGASGDGVIGDTWTYDGATATWTKINSATSPKARVGASAAFDQGRQAVILFGGSDSSGVMNDTWKFDGTSWSVVATDSSPSGRVFSGMAYDAAAGRARVELVGGYDTHDVLGDRWVLGLGAPGWRHEVAAGSPGPRAGHVLAYDASLNRLVLYGGTDSDTLRFDTWVFDGTWHQLATTAHPPSSVGIGAGFFPSVAPGVNRLVIFGGYDGTVATNQTWSLDTDWLREADASLPTTREQATFALLPGVGGVMFGGSGGASDTWVFANGGWIPLRSAGGPGQRQGSAMAFDGTRMVLFGGRPNTLAPAGDTWLFDGRRWTASAATGPTARSNQAMVYDPVRHKTLMFGGQAASGPLGDTWLWDGTGWTQSQATGPAARSGH
ncbi:MAG TPA: kelch repeat-containing protein, partial [Gemmatimonadales bacterium]